MHIIKTSISYLFLFFLLGSSTLFSQVEFEAKVSKTKLGINERLRIDFSMNMDGDNFSPPSFDGFLATGPSQQVSQTYFNGKKSFNKTYSFFLTPKAKGTFRIEQATIEINGEVYKTSPISITVTKAIDKPKDENSADYIASEKIHLIAEVSKSDPYLNEAISVVYKLYVAVDTGVSNWREIDNPRFNDFWSQNIKMNGVKIEKGKYRGEDYRYVVLRKTVLYPQKIGKLEIEPLVLDVTVDVPTKKRDFFGRRQMAQAHRTISAGKRVINVKELPAEGKPADFTGAVGDFKFNVSLSKDQLDASESLQAKVEVSGEGNLKLFNLPKLNLPSSLEVYEPEHEEHVSTDLSGMSGRISDTYTVIPQFKGKYPVPKISFSYFDLDTESYKRITSDELLIDVLEGPINNLSNNENLAASAANKQPVDLKSNQFAFIKTSTNLRAINEPDFFKSKLFWSSLLLPLLAIPLALVIRRRKDERDADIIGNKVRRADKLARRYLGEAKKNIGNKEAFYEALERALHNYLKATLRIETSEFTKERIKMLLVDRKVKEDTSNEFIRLLKNCELARYTPITTVEMEEDYRRSSKTIAQIDKEIS